MKKEHIFAYGRMNQRVPEKTPSCRYCNAMMDNVAYSFASKSVVDGVVYYCNNPVCNGGQQTKFAYPSAEKESGTQYQ